MKHSLIGEQIRYLRQKKGLTQQELAKKVGVSWEMISRYERGVSSSLSKIEPIAEALDATPIELLQKSYNPNGLNEQSGIKIPFFMEIPTNFDFKRNSTHYFYSAPEWILETDKESFMIASEIVDIKTIQLKDNGPIYISPNSKPLEGDMVMFKSGNRITIDLLQNHDGQNEILGVILAQENRYK